MRNRKLNRLKGYNYSNDNLYFVSICVDGMICCLGEVVMADSDQPVGTGRDLSVPNAKMQLNEYGEIVAERLKWLEEQYPYVKLHEHVVMPNHVHAVIQIDKSMLKGKNLKIKSLSSLIGAFKTTSSKLIHLKGFKEFAWKRSFHDHIIRSDQSYSRISTYIESNPKKWSQDEFNPIK